MIYCIWTTRLRQHIVGALLVLASLVAVTPAYWLEQGRARVAEHEVGTEAVAHPAAADHDTGDPQSHLADRTTPRTTQDLINLQEQAESAIQKVTPCVVGIESGRSQGSGVIVSSQGLILTAAHVARKPGVEVTIHLSTGKKAKGVTLGMNYTCDTAMVQIKESGDSLDGSWPTAELGDSSALELGQWCLALGHPGGYHRNRPPVARIGRVISASDSILRTDNTLIGGDSGGPLFDLQGRIIGIHTRIGPSSNANLHIPIDLFRAHWQRMARSDAWGNRSGQVGTPFLGIAGESHLRGVRITQVLPDMPAAQAQLKVGDVITHLGSHRVTTFEQLNEAVLKQGIGETVTLTCERAGSRVEVNVFLVQRPPQLP